MTREEEIMDKAIELAKKAEISRNILPKSTLVATAVDMARWADEHPPKGLVDIDKVYKWLEENLHMYNTSECEGDKIAFVEDFKKAMEE